MLHYLGICYHWLLALFSFFLHLLLLGQELRVFLSNWNTGGNKKILTKVVTPLSLYKKWLELSFKMKEQDYDDAQSMFAMIVQTLKDWKDPYTVRQQPCHCDYDVQHDHCPVFAQKYVLLLSCPYLFKCVYFYGTLTLYVIASVLCYGFSYSSEVCVHRHQLAAYFSFLSS